MAKAAHQPRPDVRLALIGAGWITPAHLAALDRLGRTELVGVASARIESAEAVARPRDVAAYDDVSRLLDEQRPDVVYVCVPPSAAVAICEQLVERGIPFLTEKPLAATDAAGPARVAAGIAERGLVVAVGYHVRALEAMPEVRERLAANPARLVTARWLSGTPAPAWWQREAGGGGQVVEQATHFYDLARWLVGEATVVGAVSVRDEPVVPPGADVVDATAAVLRFETGAVGSFANTRRLASAVVEFELGVGRPDRDDPACRRGTGLLRGVVHRRPRRADPGAGARPVRDAGRSLPRCGRGRRSGPRPLVVRG